MSPSVPAPRAYFPLSRPLDLVLEIAYCVGDCRFLQAAMTLHRPGRCPARSISSWKLLSSSHRVWQCFFAARHMYRPICCATKVVVEKAAKLYRSAFKSGTLHFRARRSASRPRRAARLARASEILAIRPETPSVGKSGCPCVLFHLRLWRDSTRLMSQHPAHF